MKQRECVEVRIRPQLSFVVPEGITNQELNRNTLFYWEDGTDEATFTSSLDGQRLWNLLNTVTGRLTTWLNGKGYDVKFMREG